MLQPDMGNLGNLVPALICNCDMISQQPLSNDFFTHMPQRQLPFVVYLTISAVQGNCLVLYNTQGHNFIQALC